LPRIVFTIILGKHDHLAYRVTTDNKKQKILNKRALNELCYLLKSSMYNILI